MDKEQGRMAFYGMSMDDWKAKYQTDASPEKQDDFKAAFKDNVDSV